MLPLSALFTFLVAGFHFTRAYENENEGSRENDNMIAKVRRAFGGFGMPYNQPDQCLYSVPCHLLAGPLHSIRALLNEIETFSSSHCQHPQGLQSFSPQQQFTPPQTLPQFGQQSVQPRPQEVLEQNEALFPSDTILEPQASQHDMPKKKKKKPCLRRRSGKNNKKSEAAKAKIQVMDIAEDAARDEQHFSRTDDSERNASFLAIRDSSVEQEANSEMNSLNSS